MHRRSRIAAIAAVTAVALASASAAHAATAGRPDFQIGFIQTTPPPPTARPLHSLSRAADAPEGKPPQVQRVVLQLPDGTRINQHALPACSASDQDLMTQGRNACPPQSKLGQGTLTADAGVGGPQPTEVTLFNTPTGFVEDVQEPGTNVTLGTDRATLNGTTFTETPPQTPGGPPDGQTVPREVKFTFDAPGYFTTPSTCPADGQWTSRGTFTQADSPTMSVTSTTPCTSVASTPVGPQDGSPPPKSGCSAQTGVGTISSARLRRGSRHSALTLRLTRAARVKVVAHGLHLRRKLGACHRYSLSLPRSAKRVWVVARSSAGVERRKLSSG